MTAFSNDPAASSFFLFRRQLKKRPMNPITVNDRASFLERVRRNSRRWSDRVDRLIRAFERGEGPPSTLAPRIESLLLEGDRLTMESAEPKRRRTLQLDHYPALGVFVDSIRATLAGDLAALTRAYHVELAGEERKWRLLLRPVDAETQQMVSEIRIGGSRNWVSSIEFLQPGGDRSVMTITREAP